MPVWWSLSVHTGSHDGEVAVNVIDHVRFVLEGVQGVGGGECADVDQTAAEHLGVGDTRVVVGDCGLEVPGVPFDGPDGDGLKVRAGLTIVGQDVLTGVANRGSPVLQAVRFAHRLVQCVEEHRAVPQQVPRRARS